MASRVSRCSMKAICQKVEDLRKIVLTVLRSGETEFRYERNQPSVRSGANRRALQHPRPGSLLRKQKIWGAVSRFSGH
jgi:hypothetical protein